MSSSNNYGSVIQKCRGIKIAGTWTTFDPSIVNGESHRNRCPEPGHFNRFGRHNPGLSQSPMGPASRHASSPIVTQSRSWLKADRGSKPTVAQSRLWLKDLDPVSGPVAVARGFFGALHCGQAPSADTPFESSISCTRIRWFDSTDVRRL